MLIMLCQIDSQLSSYLMKLSFHLKKNKKKNSGNLLNYYLVLQTPKQKEERNYNSVNSSRALYLVILCQSAPFMPSKKRKKMLVSIFSHYIFILYIRSDLIYFILQVCRYYLHIKYYIYYYIHLSFIYGNIQRYIFRKIS